MKRRDFLVATAMLATATRQSMAQRPGITKRVAMLHPAMKPKDMDTGGDPTFAIIFEEMKRLGYVEGTNLIVGRYSPEGRFDRFPELFHEVVAGQPDVILTLGPASLVKSLQTETRTIPIVAWTGDPIVAGIASSLARPGGNVTGLTVSAGTELGAKRFELIAEAVGKLSGVGVLPTPVSWEEPLTKRFKEAAEKIMSNCDISRCGLRLRRLSTGEPSIQCSNNQLTRSQ